MKTLDRRTVLRGAGGVALALPLLDCMRPRHARAATGGTRRVLFVFMPNGNEPGKRFTATGEKTFKFGEYLAPLEPHRGELLVMNGVNKMLNKLPPNVKGDNHQQGGAGLAPWPAGSGSFPVGGGGRSIGYVEGPSADYELGDRVLKQNAGMRHRHLVFRVGDQHNNIWSVCSHAGPVGKQNPVSPDTDPHRAYARIFSGINFGGEAKPDVAIARKLALKQSALDLVLQEAQGLKLKLGTDDQHKLDQHLQSLRDIERSLQNTKVPEVGGGCQAVMLGNKLDPFADENHAIIAEQFFKIGAMAFACDLTRVINFAWARNTSNRVYKNLGLSEGHHDISHKNNEGAYANLRKINKHLWQQNLKLHDALKAIPEGDGTVWDNTLIVHWNELTEGQQHTLDNDLVIFTGGASGHFKMGRMLEFNKAAAFPDLLLHTFHYMGFTDVTRFGAPVLSSGKGPVVGLT